MSVFSALQIRALNVRPIRTEGHCACTDSSLLNAKNGAAQRFGFSLKSIFNKGLSRISSLVDLLHFNQLNHRQKGVSTKS